MDIFEKIFGVKVFIDSQSFRPRFVRRNPYIVGEWLESGEGGGEWREGRKVEGGRKFTVYVGKDGIKLVPFDRDVFIKLVFSLRVSHFGKAVFVDGNSRGFSLILIHDGRVEKFFVRSYLATSNSNEVRAIQFASQRFPGIPIFSDSSYAISVMKKLDSSLHIVKVRAHHGNIWNTLCDYMLKKFLLQEVES